MLKNNYSTISPKVTLKFTVACKESLKVMLLNLEACEIMYIK